MRAERPHGRPMTDPYPLDQNLGYLLNRCAQAMAQSFERCLAPHDITLAQWGALLAISAKGSATPSDVAATVGIDRGAATRLIARMEEKGLVERRQSDRDGRSVVLTLTVRARDMMPDLVALSRDVNRRALDSLGGDDAGRLLRLLSRLLSGLDQAR